MDARPFCNGAGVNAVLLPWCTAALYAHWQLAVSIKGKPLRVRCQKPSWDELHCRLNIASLCMQDGLAVQHGVRLRGVNGLLLLDSFGCCVVFLPDASRFSFVEADAPAEKL